MNIGCFGRLGRSVLHPIHLEHPKQKTITITHILQIKAAPESTLGHYRHRRRTDQRHKDSYVSETSIQRGLDKAPRTAPAARNLLTRTPPRRKRDPTPESPVFPVLWHAKDRPQSARCAHWVHFGLVILISGCSGCNEPEPSLHWGNMKRRKGRAHV